MAIEKALGTPIGTPEEDTEDSKPYVKTEYDDGSVEYDFNEDSVEEALNEGVINIHDEHYENLAEDIDEDVLRKIGAQVYENYSDDKASRAGWMDTVNGGLSLLGIDLEETDDPFPGACSAHHPLILEAAVKFQAKAANELFNPKGPVKTAIIGKSTPEKEDQAKRVRNHMNYQVMHQMEEYFDETETMLFYLPIVGSAFKKTYYDSLLDRPVSTFIPVDQFVVDYYASNLRNAPCFTHVIQRLSNDLKKDQKSGFYRDITLGIPSVSEEGDMQVVVDDIMGVSPDTEESVYTLLEQYCYLDLEDDDHLSDEDGIALPYVVTIEMESQKVLSIRRNWREADDTQSPIIPFTHYKFVPGLGFYGLGYIHLLGNLQMTLTSTMRNLVDSGAFATMQGGFVDKRLRTRSNKGPLAPGEFREVESGGMALKDAIVNLPFKEPSAVLLQMYQFIEQRGQKFADSTEQVVADATNYGPVGTTMALLEASTKFFSGVHKRLHKAQKHEFKVLAAINYEYLGDSEVFDVVGNTFEVSRVDYDGKIDVVPVSDPNVGSQSQKLTLGQAVYTAALQDPANHDLKEVSRYYYSSLGIDDDQVDKFVPPADEPQQMDPMSDLIMVQQGKPIKAFQGQEHDAHIAIKSAFLQDPASGGNPMFQQIAPRIQANIQEHMILKFQEEIAAMASTGEAQGQDQQAVISMAAQKLAQKNQQMQQLQAQSPDEARNKLADAEIQRVINETRKLEIETEDKIVERSFKALELELKKYSEDNKVLIAEMQAQVQSTQTQMKEMMSLLKESQKIKAAAEQQDKQLEVQAKEKTSKEKPKDS